MYTKLIFFISIVLGATASAVAQNGLENIVIEKYYVSNAADEANANTALVDAGYTGTLPVGSVTWRIYADLLPGWGVQAVYGVSGHPLILTTTTSFFNHPNGNTTGGNFASNSTSIIGDGTTLLDSYLSCGAVAPGRFGVIKTEDNSAAVPAGGGPNLVINPSSVLANNDPSASPALTTADGIYNTANNPSLIALTLLGDVAGPPVNIFTDGAVSGGSFNSTNCSWGVLGQQVGAFPVGTNRVLIGQFTTDGVFTYALNLQIRNTTTFAVQNFVSSNPVGSEILLASLSGTVNQTNAAPTVSITAPVNGANFTTGASVNITANAADSDGSVTQVEFFVNGVSIGVDNSSPYSVNWTAVAGTQNLTAKATDNNGASTTSSVVIINVNANVPPTVSITAPANGATFTSGAAVAITATAADADGSVTQVQFFINGVSVGTDITSPYTVNWTAVTGSQNLTAIATDNNGATTTSSAVVITVNPPANVPPTVSIIAPVNGATFTAGATVAITATSADSDGSVTQVQFFVNGVSVGTDNTSPYSVNWTAVTGTLNLTAVATDNNGATTTSSAVVITVNPPANIPPTVSITAPANGAGFLVGAVVNITAIAADADGTVSQVEFFVNGVSVGVDNTSPFAVNWTATIGQKNLTAVVTDNNGATTTSSIVVINVNSPSNNPPTVSITAPANGASFPSGAIVTIDANAADSDGTITQVEFFVNGVSVGVDNTAPYSVNWPSVAGTQNLTAMATDNNGAMTTSAVVVINVAAPPNNPPTVSILSPANGAGFTAGSSIPITANAADNDGVVTQVEFFVNGVSIGIDNTSPYSVNWTAVAGAQTLTATATDDDGAVTTSATVVINVNASTNVPPVVSITAPSNGANFTAGASVLIIANATDSDGSVVQVEFFVNGVSIGVDNSTPYSVNWTATAGNQNLTAVATDDSSAVTTSSVVVINVTGGAGANLPPTVVITAPSNGANFQPGDTVTITANASDSDGNVIQVEFFVNGVSIGTDNNAPYVATWTAQPGQFILTAVATDDSSATATSKTVTVNVKKSAGSDYTAGILSGLCNDSTFCMPVTAVAPVTDLIGYDIVLGYDKTKVSPTGIVFKRNDLLQPNFDTSMVNTAYTNDAINSQVYISVFFNGTAPANARFSGIGDVVCVEFAKTGMGVNDIAVFELDTVMESKITGVRFASTDDGSYTNYPDSLFSSHLKFWFDSSPIRYDAASPASYLRTDIYGNTANCGKRSVALATPDTNGNFTVNFNSVSSLEFVKDILSTTDVQPVVNGFDAFLTQQVLINDPAFVPSVYQIIAMDVNTDGFVSAGDLSQINQRTVLFIPEFLQDWNYNAMGVSNGEPSRDWLFVDSSVVVTDPAYSISTTYPGNDGIGFSKFRVPNVGFCNSLPVTNNGGCPLVGSEEYIGILLGDVNGNYASNNGAPSPFRSNAGRIIVDLQSVIVDDLVQTVPVYVESMEPVHAIDLAFAYDHSNLSFKGVLNTTGNMRVLSHENPVDGQVRITSSTTAPLNTDFSFWSINMETNPGAIQSGFFNKVKGYINGEPAPVDFRFGSDTPAPSMISAYPNPAKDVLNVFVAEDALVELFDMNGRLIESRFNVPAGVRTAFSVETLSDGVYVLKANTGKTVSTLRVIVRK